MNAHKRPSRRRILSMGLTCLAVAALASETQAQGAYPDKPVTIVVPFGAGGTTDLLGRILAERLSARMGQRFIVENKAGAGGNIGVNQVAKAPKDGYTIGMGTVSTHAINPNVYRTMPFDHVKDFAPLSLVASVPNLLMVNNAVPARTVPELIAYLKANPGKFNFASSGAGTSIHMAGELFKIMAGVEMTHVPYRSSAQVTQDLISGQVQVTFDNITIAWPQIQAGNIRALATATPARIAAAPDLPAVAEFLPGFAATSWHGLFAPAGTPQAIVDRLSNEVQAILKLPEVVKQLADVGVTAVGSTQGQFVEHISAETRRWAEVAAKANVKID
jgi:tripartite-type tricarboxylate transporter receptor subunit TctC